VQGWPVIPDLSPAVIHWPFVTTLLRLLLALAVGVFVGLEREHRAKAGARTFACASLIGWGGGMTAIITRASWRATCHRLGRIDSVLRAQS
jgi:uncharacterized membrane protein YhiD involved in acid resistance